MTIFPNGMEIPLMLKIVSELSLDTEYLEKVLMENRHPVSFSQPYLL